MQPLRRVSKGPKEIMDEEFCKQRAKQIRELAGGANSQKETPGPGGELRSQDTAAFPRHEDYPDESADGTDFRETLDD
jgi:hypothetical protein